MDEFRLRLRFALSLRLPLLAVLLSAAIVLVPAVRVYLRWKTAIGNSDKLMLTMGEFQMMIPREHLLRSAVEMNAMREQGTISLLNAPGYLLGALASQLVVHHANGFPDSLRLFLWRVLSLPLFAIPAWFFAGRGIDGLLLRQRMRLFDLVLSAILVLLSLALSAGLRFGLSESERASDKMLVSYISGFAWWSLLFAFPLSAWVRQRLRRVNTA
jgi:hypothetical protein